MKINIVAGLFMILSFVMIIASACTVGQQQQEAAIASEKADSVLMEFSEAYQRLEQENLKVIKDNERVQDSLQRLSGR